MDEPSILVLKPGQLKAPDRAALRKVGVVVVEVDSPEEVRFMRPNAELSSTEMLVAAFKAISRQGTTSYLGDEIIKAVIAKFPA